MLLDLLYNVLQSGLRYEGTLAMVPLQMSLFSSGQLTLKEFIDYVRDAALLANGYELNSTPEDEADEELQNLEDEFNRKLDIIEELAEKDEYAEAIKILDEAFAMAEKEPLLFYDRCTMYNNRAYYNFRLGNFEEALKDCDTAIEDTESGLFYHTKAEVYFGMGRFEEAMKAINKAIELEPGGGKEEFKAEIANKLK
jgi:tetratricopeptide (TPR) repeat protein